MTTKPSPVAGNGVSAPLDPIPATPSHSWVRNVVYSTSDIDIRNRIMVIIDPVRVEVGAPFCYRCKIDWDFTNPPCVVSDEA